MGQVRNESKVSRTSILVSIVALISRKLAWALLFQARLGEYQYLPKGMRQNMDLPQNLIYALNDAFHLKMASIRRVH
jgi:hypothetical protein